MPTATMNDVDARPVAGTIRLCDELAPAGWRVEEPDVGNRPTRRPNPAALTVCGYRYRTLVSPPGVLFALDPVELYVHKNHVYRSDPTVTHPDTATLAGIVTPEAYRRTGLASAALAELCAAADRLGITLSLEPVQLDGYGKGKRLTTAGLQKWYGRHGFAPVASPGFPADYSIMRRTPAAG